MKYKKYTFNVPADWDLKHCFIKIDGNKITIDHPVDHTIFERYETEMFDERGENQYDRNHYLLDEALNKLSYYDYNKLLNDITTMIEERKE